MADRLVGKNYTDLPKLRSKIKVKNSINQRGMKEFFYLQRCRNKELMHKRRTFRILIALACMSIVVQCATALAVTAETLAVCIAAPGMAVSARLSIIVPFIVVLLITLVLFASLPVVAFCKKRNTYEDFTSCIKKFCGTSGVDYNVMCDFLVLKEAVREVYETLMKENGIDEDTHRDLIWIKGNLDGAFSNSHITAVELLVTHARKWAQKSPKKTDSQTPSELLRDLFGSKESTKENSALLEEMAQKMNRLFREDFLNKESKEETVDEVMRKHGEMPEGKIAYPYIESRIGRRGECQEDWRENWG